MRKVITTHSSNYLISNQIRLLHPIRQISTSVSLKGLFIHSRIELGVEKDESLDYN